MSQSYSSSVFFCNIKKILLNVLSLLRVSYRLIINNDKEMLQKFSYKIKSYANFTT